LLERQGSNILSLSLRCLRPTRSHY